MDIVTMLYTLAPHVLHVAVVLALHLVDTLNAMNDAQRYALMASPEWASIVRLLHMVGAVVWEDGSVQYLHPMQ